MGFRLSPVHSKVKIRVSLLQEVLFAVFLLQEVLFAVHSVGVSKYGHHTAQAQESLFCSGATKEAVFMLGRLSSGNEYVAMVIS